MGTALAFAPRMLFSPKSKLPLFPVLFLCASLCGFLCACSAFVDLSGTPKRAETEDEQVIDPQCTIHSDCGEDEANSCIRGVCVANESPIGVRVREVTFEGGNHEHCSTEFDVAGHQEYLELYYRLGMVRPDDSSFVYSEFEASQVPYRYGYYCQKENSSGNSHVFSAKGDNMGLILPMGELLRRQAYIRVPARVCHLRPETRRNILSRSHECYANDGLRLTQISAFFRTGSPTEFPEESQEASVIENKTIAVPLRKSIELEASAVSCHATAHVELFTPTVEENHGVEIPGTSLVGYRPVPPRSSTSTE